ncbi:MAG: hypothetical protein DDG60_11570 [Anaerolineae bacterium]|nr:MAG: hypothetical protein DDG60_11570 [Anaerolineae bacterium]
MHLATVRTLSNPTPSASVAPVPHYSTQTVQAGWRTITERVPRFITQTVQNGWKTITERVPRFITQTVQEGWKTITERVPRFITQTVQEGWKTITERVPRFITQTVQQGYKTIVQPVTEWVSRTIWEPVKKWIPGLGWLAEKVKKTVVEPVTRFVTKTVPNFVTKTVQAGWDFVTRTVPNFVTKTVQVGWDFVTKTVPNFVTHTVQSGWNFVTRTVPNLVTRTLQTGGETLQTTKQSLDDLWHRRSVRIRLAATVVAVTMPSLFASVNLATYRAFHVPAVTWFGVGSERKGVETALANQTAIQDVVNNYNAAIASGTTFTCEYNQKGKPRKECVRSVEIHPTLIEAAVAVQSQWKIPWVDNLLMRWIQGQNHSSEGIAQVSQPELEQWADNLKKYLPRGASLSPQDAHASAGAVIERIAPVLEYCQQQNCDTNSQVIVAAMAQNGKGFTAETLQNIYNAPEKQFLNPDGSINWEKYFEKQGPRPIEGNAATLISRFMQNIRAVPGNFERQFMLQLYVNDLKMLQAKGETLPDGVNLEYLACLADRLPGASYHCESGKDK